LVLTDKPSDQTMWRDDVLNITYTVLGIDGDEALVLCQNGIRRWNDVLHLSLFGTELTKVN
jgi:hypothetical protein